VKAAKDLRALLMEVDKMFPSSKPKLSSYNYSLGKFPYGWQFTVVNNWYAWADKGLQHEFGVYSQPELAVLAFLDYVKTNKINVRYLCKWDRT
jgi:hypothetical protein